MVRYPYTITIVSEPIIVQNEETGNFESDGEPVSFSSECNAAPAENNPVVSGPDGSNIVYEHVVSMPATDKQFKFGDKATLVKSEGTYELTVKRQSNGQFNTVLWL